MLQHREEARTAAATAAARRKTKDAARPANVRAGMPQREQVMVRRGFVGSFLPRWRSDTYVPDVTEPGL